MLCAYRETEGIRLQHMLDHDIKQEGNGAVAGGHCGELIDCLIGWLIDWSVGWLIGSIGWLCA